MPVLEEILPAGVVFFETRSDLVTPLFAEEEVEIHNAVPARRNEFITGRACAREALRALGIGIAPLVVGDRGEPLWPEGVVGSITHCQGYRACAVARGREFSGVGIDAEVNQPLPEDVLFDVASVDELDRCGPGRHPGVSADRLIFSAKESIYKVWYPTTGRWLGFEDVAIDIDWKARTFVGRLVDPPGMRARSGHYEGRWSARDGLILTAVALPT